MNYPIKMNYISISCESRQMKMDEALNWIKANIKNGWLLAEMPEKVLWLPCDKLTGNEDWSSCVNLAAFDSQTEIRLEKNYGQNEAQCRIVREKEDGEPTLARKCGYILAKAGNDTRKGFNKLWYAEHFKIDEETGMYVPFLGRFCGVKTGKANSAEIEE